MFYIKNLPTWERALRILVGLLGLGYAAMQWNGSALAIILGLSAATLAVTGLFGFCPMCAMMGRKLKKEQ